ncbi:MAG: septal ring lytic transglycosylase RlpA family protein [Terrimicrobiaceae bacterium]
MKILLCLTCLLLAACGSSYEGYKFKPYAVRGVTYTPMAPREAVGHVVEGLASHYDESFLVLFPGKTSLGENQYPWSHSAAHKTLPLPCKARVTNLRNGRSTVVRVNDRGPFVEGRELDVTTGVAKQLGFREAGLCPVRIQVLSVGDGRWRIRK